MTKLVYQTNESGIYVGPAQADESPLEPGVFLIPGGAIEVEPPALKDGQRARWRNGAWVIEDADAVEPPPPTPDATLAERKIAVRGWINAERDRRVRLPFGFGANRFDYDDASQKRITGAGALALIAITVGGKAPTDTRWHGGDEDFVWIAADNSLVPMDAATVLAFGQAAGAWDSAHVFAARVLKDAAEAAIDENALDAIDISTGWPA
jgi:hypothetical protein